MRLSSVLAAAGLFALERLSRNRENGVWFADATRSLFNTGQLEELFAWEKAARDIAEGVGEEPLDLVIRDGSDLTHLEVYLIEEEESLEWALDAVDSGLARGAFLLAFADPQYLTEAASASLADLGIPSDVLAYVAVAELPGFLQGFNLGFRMYRLLGDIMLHSGAAAVGPSRNFMQYTSPYAIEVWERLNDVGDPEDYWPEVYWFTRKVNWEVAK